MEFEDIKARFRQTAERANQIAGVTYRGLAQDWLIELKADDNSVWLANSSGRYELLETTSRQDVPLTLAASADDWGELFAEVPGPGYQTLNAMVMSGTLRIEGDSLLFHRYLMALELAFGKLPSQPVPAAEPADAFVEAIVGRYLNLVHDGQSYRIYFEEAGEGIPLLCLHTAGADGRQYRGLLNDETVTSRFRVIVFDLPRHGKSSFAPGHGGDSYVLTTDSYVSMVMAVVHALALENPVVMGCSIGGRAVLHLALRHGNEFRAAIGLQSALYADPGSEDFSGTTASVLFRPDVDGSELGAAMVAGIMAPDGPDSDPRQKWETLWYYMQGGPGVFLGDLYYYFADGDLRNRIAGGIDTDECPLYLLTGEYDLSATPAMTAELAEEVGATHFEVMPGLGHFPMSENYPRFREHLIPVLEAIS